MYKSERVVAVIPAAGSGKRMRGAVTPKPFMPLGGIPMLIHTVRRLEASGMVDDIVLVGASEAMDDMRRLTEQYSCRKVTRVVAGGPERQDSVYAGIREAGPGGMILIHDAARPFIRSERIDELIICCHETGAAIMGVRAKDTIKEVSDDRTVRRTLDRKFLWQIQTPQVFRADLLRRAHEKARTDGFNGTDEAMLVERLGAVIRVVDGDYYNIKITTPDDWPVAEAILRNHPEFFSI